MKKTTLLAFAMLLIIAQLFSQRKEKQPTGYAITAAEKGGRSWKEVKLVNIQTGDIVQSVFNSKEDWQPLNARTGKPVVKKENPEAKMVQITTGKKIVNLDQELNATQPRQQTVTYQSLDGKTVKHTYTIHQDTRMLRHHITMLAEQTNKPFATNSAAMAYDKKHERLYYTPMGINQLRYIDLKSKQPKVYYFEDEAFGTVSHPGDAAKQITRMVIASDGNGYALTNDGNHLIKFTTGKKPVITDLGALTDDATNAKYSVHNRGGYGGDMIADKNENLYLITANRNVFKISIATKNAKFQGTIKGLPQGFSTNGAMVEEGTKVIVASSENTIGYYRFDLNSLQAEKISAEGSVFNASDLANGKLAFDKKKKDKEEKPVEPVKEEVADMPTKTAKDISGEIKSNTGISVYPNPVTNNRTRISFDDVPSGNYKVQVMDMAGKLVINHQVNVRGKGQLSEINLPAGLNAGTYVVKVSNEANNISKSVKLIVE